MVSIRKRSRESEEEVGTSAKKQKGTTVRPDGPSLSQTGSISEGVQEAARSDNAGTGDLSCTFPHPDLFGGDEPGGVHYMLKRHILFKWRCQIPHCMYYHGSCYYPGEDVLTDHLATTPAIIQLWEEGLFKLETSERRPSFEIMLKFIDSKRLRAGTGGCMGDTFLMSDAIIIWFMRCIMKRWSCLECESDALTCWIAPQDRRIDFHLELGWKDVQDWSVAILAGAATLEEPPRAVWKRLDPVKFRDDDDEDDDSNYAGLPAFYERTHQHGSTQPLQPMHITQPAPGVIVNINPVPGVTQNLGNPYHQNHEAQPTPPLTIHSTIFHEFVEWLRRSQEWGDRDDELDKAEAWLQHHRVDIEHICEISGDTWSKEWRLKLGLLNIMRIEVPRYLASLPDRQTIDPILHRFMNWVRKQEYWADNVELIDTIEDFRKIIKELWHDEWRMKIGSLYRLKAEVMRWEASLGSRVELPRSRVEPARPTRDNDGERCCVVLQHRYVEDTGRMLCTASNDKSDAIRDYMLSQYVVRNS